MRSYSITTARREFAAVLNTVADEETPVLLTRHDKPVVAIVPLKDFEELQRLRGAADPADALHWQPLDLLAERKEG